MSNRQERRAQKARERNLRPPRTFRILFPTPEALVAIGPVCKGNWCVPGALERRLRDAGRPVPDPVEGYFIIDTGASSTCIALDVALQLKLTESDSRETFGAHGRQKNRVFEARFQLSIEDDKGNRSTLTTEKSVTAVPEIEKAVPAEVFVDDRFPKRLVGLIGRDFLRHAKVVYDGPRAKIEVTLDLESLPRTSK